MVTVPRSSVAAAKFFTQLGYSTCWEDPEVLRQALLVTEKDTILSITSGGDLTIGLLLEKPRRIVSIDLNAIQNYLLELKLACFRVLDYEEMLSFLGIRPCDRRLRLFEVLKPCLSSSARDYWSLHGGLLKDGILRQGKQDRYFFQFGCLLRHLLGQKKVDTLLEITDLRAQQELFDHSWNGLRWRWLFDLFFSRTVMSLYMDPAHFELVKDKRFGPLIRKRVDRILRESPIWENYFIHWVLTKTYRDGSSMPPYLQEKNFETIRSQMDRITIVTDEIETFLLMQPSQSFSKFNLSNIFDWVDDESFAALLREIVRVARPKARVCYYNLLHRRIVPETWATFKRHVDLALELLNQNRAMGYTNFELYEIDTQPKAEKGGET
jgi:S-adenosylmethionine-diacylglycerol 3-amino-3-carboxypropyl transferase